MSDNRKPLLVLLIFFIAIIFHLIGINKIGRTWDEQFKVDMGYIAWDRIFAGDFSIDSWKMGEEHPMVAKYIYGLFIRPEMIRLDDGRGLLRAFLSPEEAAQINNGNYIITQLYDKLFAVNYDFGFPRIISALFNSLAIAATVGLGFLILRNYWVLLPGLFLILTPRVLVMGQLMTYESLSLFFFSAAVIFLGLTLKNPQKTLYYITTGIFAGLAFWTRYGNIYVFIFLFGWILLHWLFKKDSRIFNLKLILIPLVSFSLGVIIWPLIWHDFPKYLLLSFQEHQTRPIVPSLYFVHRILITTPIPVLIGLFVGIFFAFKKNIYFLKIILWWFFSALVFYSLVSIQMGGIRYIILIYPALALLSAYGFSRILKGRYVFLLILLFAFMLWDVIKVFPYYLDYYNQLAGGVKGAVEKNYEFSWWGEGQREVGFWINKNIPFGSSVGLMVTPKYVFPSLRKDLKNKGYLDKETEVDYLVVSFIDLKKLSKNFRKNYRVIYQAKVDSEPLVFLFEKNKK